MALINCPECGLQVSSHAKACPHCGFPIDEQLVPQYMRPEDFCLEGDYVYYGRYPHDKVTDGVLIDSLSEFKAGPNEIIIFQGEEYAEVYGFYYLFQPIRWRILSREGNKALVMSDRLLDAHRYDPVSNNYADSEIRRWLNDDFLAWAFRSGGKRIIPSHVDNSESTCGRHNPYASPDTYDKIFLLSFQDYCNDSYGFLRHTGFCQARACKTTDYARAKGAYGNSHPSYLNAGRYWTRSPYDDLCDPYDEYAGTYEGKPRYTWVVGCGGGLNDGPEVSDTELSVRPALWINVAE